LDLAAGLEPGHRFRCSACGNLTRFDVETVERMRRFWHAELSGDARADEEERLSREVVAVTCRWCGSDDAIEVVESPAGGLDVGDGAAQTT
jgi:RNase P subunit RPR2